MLFDFIDLHGSIEEQAREAFWTNQDRTFNGLRIVSSSSLNFISKGLGIKNLLQVLLRTTTELSEIAKRNLDSNTELWKAESKYINLEPCSTIYINNPVGSAVDKISMIKSVLPFSVTFRIYYY